VRLGRLYVILVGLGAVLLPFFLLQCKTNSHQISVLGKFESPSDNPYNEEKVALGRMLFFDKRLSRNETVSCASCHNPAFAFTDQKTVSEGVEGRKTERNAPSLLNSAYLETVMFDAHLSSLELQVIVPIQEHVEMDMDMKTLLARLRKDEYYVSQAKTLFNRDVDAFVLTRSIAAFERSLISENSRFDQFYSGTKPTALTKDEKAGWKLFSEKLYCTKCHPAPHFTTFIAENNGLYKQFGEDKGRFRIFNDSNDIGFFKIPSLRNIELTFPYMHDGSIKSIEAVIQHYATGGKQHHLQNKNIIPFHMNAREIKQLTAFLFSLTDTSYMEKFR
jgi:cytochrome c peroxidase